MKAQIRVLGIDDSPFKFREEKVVVVGVVVRLPSYLEGVLRTEVDVDGTNATDKLAELISNSRYKEGLALIMVDGIALGGFNVVDIDELHERTSIPVATITREEPDLKAIAIALRKKFKDWEWRLEVVSRGPLKEVKTKHNPLFVQCRGMEFEDLKKVIEQSTVRGALPEPIRMAHLIATAIRRGESYGRA